jgi:hypothetical protein
MTLKHRLVLRGLPITVHKKADEDAWSVTCEPLGFINRSLMAEDNIAAMKEALYRIGQRASEAAEYWKKISKRAKQSLRANVERRKRMPAKVRVSLNNETTVHVAEHEILLSFENDDGAEAFTYWWNEVGEALMAAWCLDNNFEGEVEKST